MISNYKKNFINLLFVLLPISFILGNSAINLNIGLIALFFLVDLTKDRKIFYNENRIFFFIFFVFAIYLLISSLISNYYDNENLLKAFLYIRFFLFALAIKFYIDNDKINFNLIAKFWLIFLFIVIIDIFYESIVGKNMLGYISPSAGRLVSFFKDELIVGFFVSTLGLISFSILIYKNRKYSLLFLLLIPIIFLTGERSSFIKIFFAISMISIIVEKNFFDKKIFFSSFLLIIILLTLVFNFSNHQYFEDIKKRYSVKYIEKDNWYSIGGLSLTKPAPCKAESCKGIIFDDHPNLYYKTHYGKYYLISKHIFLDNIFFGTGYRTFRKSCADYVNILDSKYRLSNPGCTTHPHQIYYELISDHGLLGTFVILSIILYLLIKPMQYFKIRHDIFKLSLFFYLIAYLLPIIPSGSFFTTVNSSIFWLFYGLYIANNKLTNTKKIYQYV